ncbi:MAG: hypothetical protein M1276_00595 [Deltaproteobacteria bacterium]|jgi:hypothetical protein|nr:hypothetical protein [Deltaproteobacteria bacterium]
MQEKVVFISVPYSKDPCRGEELSYLCGLYVRKQGKIPFSPVFNFQNFFDNGNEYETVLEHCKVMLSKSDEVLLIEDGIVSNGQLVEEAEAIRLNKPVVKIESQVLENIVNGKNLKIYQI